MANSQLNEFECAYCGFRVSETDDFCTTCGTLFRDEVSCKNHPQEEAEAVCMICREPFCPSCGERLVKRFLCAAHRTYEIVEGMARVLGESDAAQIAYAESCLKQEGLHPFVYVRKASPLSGGPEYTLFRASGEYDGHLINEYKLMVPCEEVLQAEETLKRLELTPDKAPSPSE